VNGYAAFTVRTFQQPRGRLFRQSWIDRGAGGRACRNGGRRADHLQHSFGRPGAGHGQRQWRGRVQRRSGLERSAAGLDVDRRIEADLRSRRQRLRHDGTTLLGTISSFNDNSLGSASNVYNDGLGDNNVLAWGVSYTDGDVSGTAVLSATVPVAVPEPGSAAVLALLGLPLLGRRRRRSV